MINPFESHFVTLLDNIKIVSLTRDKITPYITRSGINDDEKVATNGSFLVLGNHRACLLNYL